MTRDGALCDWDAEAGLLVLRLGDGLRSGPLVAVMRERVRRGVRSQTDYPAADAASDKWTHRVLREIHPHEDLVVLRAPKRDPKGADFSFELLLFAADAKAADAGRESARGETARGEPSHALADRAEDARAAFAFRSDLIYVPTASETTSRRTRLRYFWPTGAPGELASAPGPNLPEGARPGLVLDRVFAEHQASGGGPFAASASVSDGRARGPTVRALPDERAPLEVEFGWLEEHFAELAPAGRSLPEGFETSRFPVAEIDLTAYGAAAPAAAGAVWFLHAPLGPDGYVAEDLIVANGAVEPEEDRLLLRHAWPDAAHRDLIGVWARLGRPLKASGLLPLVGRADPAAPDAPETEAARAEEADADAAFAVYLGEVARDVFAATDKSLAPGSPEQGRLLADAREEIEACLAQAAEIGGRQAREADRGAARLGLDWAEDAIRGAGRRGETSLHAPPAPDLDGARRAAPETIAAFLETRARVAQTALAGAASAVVRAFAALDLDVETFERFRDQGDAALALLADPDLAAALSQARRPLRGDLSALSLRFADAAFNQDVAGWWERVELSPDSAPAQLGLWRLLRAGADLAAVRRSGLAFGATPPPVADILAGVQACAAADDRKLAAKIVVDLDDPAVRRDAEHLVAPETLDHAAAAARALTAAERAVRRDLDQVAAACRAARAPEPEPFDAVWAKHRRRLSAPEQGEAFAIAGSEKLERDLRDASELAVKRVAQQAGGPALAEALDGLVTRLVRLDAIDGLERYVRDVETLNAIYAQIRDAIWCPPEAFASAMRGDDDDDAEATEAEREAAAKAAAETAPGRILQDARAEARRRGGFERTAVAAEVDTLRRLALSGPAPVWIAPQARAMQQGFLRAAQRRLAAAERILGPALAGDGGPGVSAAEADLRAAHAGLPWIAARQVWRFVCVLTEETLQEENERGQTGRVRDAAARLALRLSEPAESWPDIQAELERLRLRVAERDRIAEARRGARAPSTRARGQHRRSARNMMAHVAEELTAASEYRRPPETPPEKPTERRAGGFTAVRDHLRDAEAQADRARSAASDGERRRGGREDREKSA